MSFTIHFCEYLFLFPYFKINYHFSFLIFFLLINLVWCWNNIYFKRYMHNIEIMIIDARVVVIVHGERWSLQLIKTETTKKKYSSRKESLSNVFWNFSDIWSSGLKWWEVARMMASTLSLTNIVVRCNH